jgi:hypothetical protein
VIGGVRLSENNEVLSQVVFWGDMQIEREKEKDIVTKV